MQKSDDLKATIAALLAILTFLIFFTIFCHIKEELRPITTQTEVTVQQGDSLWSIAETNCPNQDPREVIHNIEKTNRLGEFLHPGDVLTVPREVGLVQEASR